MTDSPDITVPTVEGQCIASGDTTVAVTWTAVSATNIQGQMISCSGPVGSTDVTVSGGTFSVGDHAVTCTVSNDGGCTSSETFTISVAGKKIVL